MKSIFNKKIFSFLLFLILIILVVYLLEILIPFFIGLIAYLLDPLVDYLEENKIKRAIATSITLLLFFLIILILCFLIFPILSIQLKNFLIEFPTVIKTLNQKINFVIEYLQKKTFQESNFDLLNNREKEYLFNYHLNVYTKISKFLNKEEKKWLVNLL